MSNLREKFRVMTLFEIFEVDLEKRTIEVKVSANFDYILNKLETQFGYGKKSL